LYNTHTGMTGGHFGQSKTLFQVKRRFHWGTWKTDVIRYCRQCPQCCQYQDKVKPYTGPEPISWLKEPESTGPTGGENEVMPLTDHLDPFVDPPENGPSEIRSPQIKTPGIRPQRARRPPKHLAGYEWGNQALMNHSVRTV